MKKFKCQECGNEFAKNELDKELFNEGEYYCQACAIFLLECGKDAIDPDWKED